MKTANTNTRPNNRHTPIALIMDNVLIGNYCDFLTAKAIGQACLKTGTARTYRIYRADRLIDEA